ncbi:MAG: MGMT family protein [Acidimicrobiales bacterium]
MPDAFRARVVEVISSTRPGEVVSYGDVAAQAGHPGAARAVGAVLAASDPEDRLPWWRVVYGDGRLAPGHRTDQARRLQAEGVTVRGGRVALAPRAFRRSGRRSQARRS